MHSTTDHTAKPKQVSLSDSPNPNDPKSAGLPVDRMTNTIGPRGIDFERVPLSPPNKKRKYSTDGSDKHGMLDRDSYTLFLKANGRASDSEDIISIENSLNAIKEKAYRISCKHVAEKAAKRKDFDASMGRANRRAIEAENKLRSCSQDYSENLKSKDIAYASELEGLKNQLEAQTVLMNDINESGIQQAAKTETIRKKQDSTIDALRHSLAEMEGQLTQKSDQLLMQEKQLILYDQLRLRVTKETQSILEKHQIADSGLVEAGLQHDKLFTLVEKLNTDFDDFSGKQWRQIHNDIWREGQEATRKSGPARILWADARKAFADFHADCSEDATSAYEREATNRDSQAESS